MSKSSIAYIVSRFNCPEENEYLQFFSSKLNAEVEYDSLFCEFKEGSIKLVKFDAKKVSEKVLRQCFITQSDINFKNEMEKELMA